MSDPQMVYVAIKPCGCVVNAVDDDPDTKKQTAKTVSNWIKCGLAVQRMTLDESLDVLKPCYCDRVPEYDHASI